MVTFNLLHHQEMQALASTGLRAVPVLYRGAGLRWPVRVPSNSTDSMVLWFHVILFPCKGLVLYRVTVPMLSDLHMGRETSSSSLLAEAKAWWTCLPLFHHLSFLHGVSFMSFSSHPVNQLTVCRMGCHWDAGLGQESLSLAGSSCGTQPCTSSIPPIAAQSANNPNNSTWSTSFLNRHRNVNISWTRIS